MSTAYFNGASDQKGYGVGIVLVSPKGAHMPIFAKLNFEVTNNVAEYKAYITGLQATAKIRVKNIQVYEDSSMPPAMNGQSVT